MSSDVLLPWSSVLDVDGAPIEETPEKFDELATFFTTLAETSELVSNSFDRLVNDSNAEFEGEAAESFKTMTGDIGSRLGDVPERAREVSGIFSTHHTDLVALREEANAALARANTRWRAVQTAETNAEAARGQSNRLQYQLDNFDTVVCGSEDHRVQVGLDLDSARTDANNAEANLDSAVGELRRSKDEWDTLQSDYEVLDEATGRKLDDVRLGDLSDPGVLSQVWGAVSGFVVDLATDLATGIWDAAVGFVTGDWERMAWGLSRALGAIVTAIAIVALFTPLNFGAALLLTSLAALKLGTDAYLFATDSVDPRTGNTISGVDLALGVLTVAGGGLATRSAAMGTNTAGGLSQLVSGQGGGQLGSTATGLHQGAGQTVVAFQSATTTTQAATSAASTFGRTVASVADDGVQAASTLGTVYDVGWHGDSLDSNWQASPFDSDIDVVSGQGASTAPGPLLEQVDGLNLAPIGNGDTYGTITLVEATEE